MMYGYPIETLCVYQYSLVSLVPGRCCSIKLIKAYWDRCRRLARRGSDVPLWNALLRFGLRIENLLCV